MQPGLLLSRQFRFCVQNAETLIWVPSLDTARRSETGVILDATGTQKLMAAVLCQFMAGSATYTRTVWWRGTLPLGGHIHSNAMFGCGLPLCVGLG